MNKRDLLVKPQQNPVYQNFTADEVGWKYLNFGARLMQKGEVWEHDTTGHEMAIVILGGNFKVDSDKGSWEVSNGRKDVFSGIAHTLYLPRHTKFTLTATSDTLDIAYSWVETDQDFEPYLKQPQEAAIEFRGGDNANRQINSLIQPGFPCHKIVCVEVYTPSGNWSSFPAHKHDERIIDADGKLIEAELEEIYFYKFQSPQAYAIQQVYTYDRSLDEIIRARNNEAVLVPKGYHPVAACHGYHAYYLNFLAGSDQVLTATNDPDHEWIYGSWKTQDTRLPLVTADMNV